MFKKSINQEVNVTALYFTNSQQLKSFPKRMEYAGREYTFIESGLAYKIKKGLSNFNLFDMTDGSADYRLKFEDQRSKWTLVSISNS
jgi:hypothetical protein